MTVRDQGPGIPAELQSQLFRPFHRLHRESHPEAHGVGLGLLLVRTVAQRHGGTVEIESAAGAGCAVTLVLPQPTEADFAAPAHTEGVEDDEPNDPLAAGAGSVRGRGPAPHSRRT